MELNSAFKTIYSEDRHLLKSQKSMMPQDEESALTRRSQYEPLLSKYDPLDKIKVSDSTEKKLPKTATLGMRLQSLRVQ